MEQKILSSTLSMFVTTTVTSPIQPIVKKLADDMNDGPFDRFAVAYRIAELNDALQTIELTFLAEHPDSSSSSVSAGSSSSGCGSQDSVANISTTLVKKVVGAFQKERAAILGLRMNVGA